MRISNNLFFQRSVSAMTEQQSQLNRTNIQLASGKKMLTASDDPASAARVLGLNKAIDTINQYQDNINRAETRLEHEETIVGSVVNLLQRANELAVQGNNDVLTATDKQSIAAEVDQLLTELMGLANTRDPDGEYIFSGFQTNTKPFNQVSAGTFSYSGDMGQRRLQISAGREIADGDNGFDLFIDVATGPHASVTGSAATNLAATGSGDISINGFSIGALPGAADAEERASQLVEAINLISDDTQVTASLATPSTVTLTSSAGDITVNSIAGTGLTSRTTAAPQAAVTSSAATSFNAIADGELTINSVSLGAIPAAADADERALQIYNAVNAVSGITNVTATMPTSDTVTLTSSRGWVDITAASTADTGLTTAVTSTTGKRSIFETLYQLGDALNNDQPVDRYINDIQSAIEHVTTQQTRIGARLNALSQQSEANTGIKLSYETRLSAEQDLDYLEAIGRFNQQMLSLQAAQQAYAKMQNLSLFNYIR